MSITRELDKNNEKESMIILSIRYAGPAVEGSMDAKELGRSLAGFEELLRDANSVIGLSSASISTRVQTEFRQGSFIVDLAINISQNVGEAYIGWLAVKNFINGSDFQAIKTLLEMIGIPIGDEHNLISFLNWLKKRKFKEEQTKNGKTEIEIINRDGSKEKKLVSKNTAQLYKSLQTRKSLEQTISPLTQEGIDEITFHIKGTPEEEKTTITKKDYPNFRIPKDEKILLKDEWIEEKLEIIVINFEGMIWKFRFLPDKERKETKGKKITALIRDTPFIKEINADKISFTKGDIINCKLRVLTYDTLGGKKIEYEILKILHLQKSHFQPEFNF